ncbi:ATP-binding protein [Stenotrophomonas maltophilia]|uniref:ATP-binding protein n=1 Tax=Stenotrophomonas maltophilia TaxID=40324 RepID=UPI0009B2C9AD|nr:ATP-binding protein [Stenotrophomonas maltophilia]MBH1678078.1 ATP-binding protein [Stenotrophomonas maltophilia]MDZ5778821.1 ATP-binding protein [Stenotrophomonas maltophilia]HDS1623861.1 ATP-binding protein [Stenotrophomonas maltophilia]HEL3199792.1 ATP-binding protein [Stenotrophomonas maltophilia]HEL3213676.1 ATP-binding protein [Stenotrophomonas maltophilia]
MEIQSSYIEVAPDVQRVSEGLRDTGYDFNTAISDIVDNSIAADASQISIQLAIDFSGEIVIAVSDNGSGMDRTGLIDAMRYGSPRRPNAKSLGKFGMGLKTASTAFARRLSVVTRSNGADALRATWDLDKLAKDGTWLLEISPPLSEEVSLLDALANGTTGTVVLWQKVDRLLDGYKDPASKHRRNALDKLGDRLGEHLSMVYQRFIDPSDQRERTVSISVNGRVIQHWDPFLIEVTKAPVMEKTLTVQAPDGATSEFTVRAFILPRKEEYADQATQALAKISIQRQGVYIYRENRLIHGPDWMGMYKHEPHYNLLRVELSFDHRLDAAFQVDIKKSRILLEEHMYEWLRDKFLAGPRREAEMRYRRGAAAVATGASLLIHSAASNVIDQKSNALSKPSVSVIDESKGEIRTDSATAKLRIVSPNDKGSLNIITSTTLENGVLWEPTLRSGGSIAVALNTGHPYYSKAYLPNKENSPVVQALDYLLWALAQAEVDQMTDETIDAFEEFRILVSRNLKKLVADLPDAPEPEVG